jgi:threonine/homoserine/homoserine lactone efflux protein
LLALESAISFFLQGAAIGIGAALSPGPFQSLVIAQSLLGGWKRAAPVTFGPLIADIPIAFTLVFLMSRVPDEFLRFVKFAGAALLLFLAWGVWKEIRAKSQSTASSDSVPAVSPLRGLAQGTFMIFLSPGPYLFWGLVLGPLLLRALDNSWLHAVVFLAGFYVFSIGGLQVIALLIGMIGQLSLRGRRILQYGSILLMLLISVFLITNGLQA